MKTLEIYKRDASGNIRVWWAEADGPQWRSHSGVLNGSIITSEWRYSPAKSQPTDELQAEAEALAENKKKLSIDYRASVDLVDVPRGSFIKPMLAHKYTGWMGKCFSQPKLDGMRCLANIDGMWSRGGKPIISCPHILEFLMPVFEKYPTLVLDGELYNHIYSGAELKATDILEEAIYPLNRGFNDLMSICKKTTPTPADIERARTEIQYHIYDMQMFDSDHADMTRFINRTMALQSMFKDAIGPYVLVSTVEVSSEEQLNGNFEKLLADGYEGQIVRLNKPYEQKRSFGLLKRKNFFDDEYHLVAIEEGAGNWEGFAKRAVCRLPNGRHFGAGIKGTQEYCLGLLRDAAKYHSVTVTSFAMTPDGIPRFPVAKAFHEQEIRTARPSHA